MCAQGESGGILLDESDPNYISKSSLTCLLIFIFFNHSLFACSTQDVHSGLKNLNDI